MKQQSDNNSRNIFALSFNKLLSVSKFMRDGVRYGNQYRLVDFHTDTIATSSTDCEARAEQMPATLMPAGRNHER